ncbi:MAG: hypothetical protein NTW94_03395 [Legionellales bacterium]|nr:hypothetical protein [Legionellales bacterium]
MPCQPSAAASERAYPIDLLNDPHWETRLLGRWIPDRGTWRFEKGLLQQAKESGAMAIDIQHAASFFKRPENEIEFKPIPCNVLYERILKPIFQNTVLEKEGWALSVPIIEIYRLMSEWSSTDEGAVVVIDEINCAPMMEALLNALLMGKTPEGKRPTHTGFLVIGTLSLAILSDALILNSNHIV